MLKQRKIKIANIISKEEEEKIRKGYKEMEEYISSRHNYYYTNPPKGINPMSLQLI